MGYRSDVSIKARKEHALVIVKALLDTKLMKYADIVQDANYIYVTMSGLKWYSDYPDVILVNKAIKRLPPKEAALVAVGEDNVISETINDMLDLEAYVVLEIYGMEPDENHKNKDEVLKQLRKQAPRYFV